MVTSYEVVCCDVGSTRRGNFGWVSWRVAAGHVARRRHGRDIALCAKAITDALEEGVAVALGLEAPGWLPIPLDADGLSCGRDGEGNRSTFAPAGAYVATLGLQQLAWILRNVGTATGRPTLTTRPSRWRSGGILLWEAFVSGDAHADSETADGHVRDAANAANEFVRLHSQGLESALALREDEIALSLFGAALAWARALGYAQTVDDEDISSPPIVVRPSTRYGGPLE